MRFPALTRFFCGNCGRELPLWRPPRNARQVLGGGWTCPRCGTELDRQGTPVQPKP